MTRSPSQYFRIGGNILKLTNLDKIFYPETGYTKRDVLKYYQEVAEHVLPHLRERFFTFRRFPDGVGEPAFYQKQCPAEHPAFVSTGDLDQVHHCLINNKQTLLWAVNLGAIELHTTLGMVNNPQCPTAMALDLDPGEDADLRLCAEVALLAKDVLAKLDLEAFPKTSGRKGLHLYVPINLDTNYRVTKMFARWLAETLERSFPDLILSKMSKKLRTGKVFLDWSQNSDFKTTVTAYSLRANDLPTVSCPITWAEVRKISKSDAFSRQISSIQEDELIRRLKKQGDLFKPVLELKQDLKPLSFLHPPKRDRRCTFRRTPGAVVRRRDFRGSSL